MKKGAKFLKGKHDFSTFSSHGHVEQNFQLKLFQKIDVKVVERKIYLIFESQSFLQQLHLKRSMVGYLTIPREEKWSLNKFKEVVKSKKCFSMCIPAP